MPVNFLLIEKVTEMFFSHNFPLEVFQDKNSDICYHFLLKIKIPCNYFSKGTQKHFNNHKLHPNYIALRILGYKFPFKIRIPMLTSKSILFHCESVFSLN